MFGKENTHEFTCTSFVLLEHIPSIVLITKCWDVNMLQIFDSIKRKYPHMSCKLWLNTEKTRPCLQQLLTQVKQTCEILFFVLESPPFALYCTSAWIQYAE